VGAEKKGVNLFTGCPIGLTGKGGGKMKGYIMSEVNGTVVIGNTLFQPCTGKQYKVSREGLKKSAIRIVDVKRKDMEGALEALYKK
jgi:hypothetical protein